MAWPKWISARRFGSFDFWRATMMCGYMIPLGPFGRGTQHHSFTLLNDNADVGPYLDAILADDAPRLIQLIRSLRFPSADIKLELTGYKFPPLIVYSTSLMDLTAFFGSEKCFFNLVQFQPKSLENSLPQCAAAGGSLGILSTVESLDFPFNPACRDWFDVVSTAVEMGHLHIVQWFHTRGLHFKAFDFGPRNAAYLAALLGNFDILKYLVDEVGMPLTPTDPIKPPDRWSRDAPPAHKTLPVTIIPLHAACWVDNVEIAAYLLSKDPRMGFLDGNGRTPFDLAIASSSLECIKLFASFGGLDPIVKQYAVLEACTAGNVEILGHLVACGFELDAVSRDGITPILTAVANSHLHIVRFLVDHGVSVSESDPFRLFLQALEVKCFALWEYLIGASGVDLSAAEEDGTQLLQHAVQGGSREFIDFLLDAGVTLPGISLGSGALTYKPELFAYLVLRGADFNVGARPPIVDVLKSKGLPDVLDFMARGAVLTPEIVRSNPDCLEHAVGKLDEKLLAFLLQYEPALTGWDTLIRCTLDPFDYHMARKKEFQ
jgi:ankyrin repeat protein